MKRHILVADGPAQPDATALDALWEQAVAAGPSLAGEHQVRSLGIDHETTETIFDFIRAGKKVTTFSLPWVMKAKVFLIHCRECRLSSQTTQEWREWWCA